MENLNLAIYDVEIIKAIESKQFPRQTGIAYCSGWSAFDDMGISCICCFDYTEQRYRVFLKDNFNEFKEMVNRVGHVMGFNNHRFDDKLCAANNLFGSGVMITSDLLAMTWKAAGVDPLAGFSKAHAGYSLDALAERNLGKKKTGNGALAPVLWQQGKIGAVVDYCLEDVRLTKMLFEKAIALGGLNHPTNLDFLKFDFSDFPLSVSANAGKPF